MFFGKKLSGTETSTHPPVGADTFWPRNMLSTHEDTSPAPTESLAIDAAPSSYQSVVETALAAGATVDEVVGTLIAVAPTIGLARVVSAAPELALALGYDVDAALEAPWDGPA